MGFTKEGYPLCIEPFTNITLQPTGGVGSCRLRGSDFYIGNIKEATIKQIWQSEGFQKWRTDFLNNHKSYCKREIDHTHCQKYPTRNDINLKNNSFDIVNPPILKLTANLNGFCNLRCRMCHIWRLPNGLYDNTSFWTEANTELFPALKEIDMLSGEPFIQKDTFKLIRAVHSVNKECRWSFTTNAHWRFSPYIKKHLDQIKIKDLIVSIDGMTQKTYEKIRPPGRLQLVMKTLLDLIEYKKSRKNDFHITWNYLVQKDNWHELSEALTLINELRIEAHPMFLYEPPEFSLLSLPKNEIINLVDLLITKSPPSKFPGVMRIVKPLIETLSPVEQKRRWGIMLTST